MARILAIHAHPDDCEILAGGTLALLADRGHDITIATMTPGDCGSKDRGPDDIAAVRRREAGTAAAIIGARCLCVEMRDLAVFDDDASRRRVTEVLRETRPQLILTSSPVDYHCDHEAASVLVRDACFGAPAPNYRTGGSAPPLNAIPHLYFMDPLAGC
jgi:LmbE family N-acetylglucosaminyl deacetylase